LNGFNEVGGWGTNRSIVPEFREEKRLRN